MEDMRGGYGSRNLMNNQCILSTRRRYVSSKVKNNTEVIVRTTEADDDALPIPNVSIPVKWWPNYIVVDCGTDVVDLLS